MTLSWWDHLWILGAPFLCGVAVLRLLGLRFSSDRVAFGGWAWLTGTIVAALVTFVWAVLAKPIDGTWLGPLFAVGSLLMLWSARSRESVVSAIRPRSREEVTLVVVLVLLAAWIVVRLLALNVKPVLYGDEASIFSQKAKVMFSAAALDLDYIVRHGQVHVQHIDYPMFDPLLHLWTYTNAGHITLVDNRWPIQVFTIALLLVLAGAIRRYVRPSVTALLLVLFFGMGIFDLNIGPSRAEMVLLTAFAVTCDAWLRWVDTRRTEWWALCCCGIAGTLWAKNEGALLLVALACGIVFARVLRAVPAMWPGRSAASAWLGLPLAVFGVHTGFNAYLGAKNDLFDPETAHTGMGFFERAVAQVTERWDAVLGHYWGDLILAPGPFRLAIPILLFACAIVPWRNLRSPMLVPFIAAFVALAGYHVVFFATPHDPTWHLPTAADRTVLHVMPAVMLALAMALPKSLPWAQSRFRD